MNPVKANIFKNIPEQLPEERFECLFSRENIKLERIISKGHSTTAGHWYDQDDDEWVMLLQGQAILRYEQDNQTFHLHAGDYLLIPAHVRHRVEWTEPDTNTIWLAAHLY
ncbi:MAG: cupin domain-containing protein [Methylococcaceae bacterium]